MGDTGLEHIQKSPEKQDIGFEGGAESGAVLRSGPAPLPPGLTEIIALWPQLPPVMQAAILMMVRASL
jgi:hypothetical protein